ncbi:MAG: TonB-dependent receptor [Lutibacter sp.]|jgi:vitamin B12 transporter
MKKHSFHAIALCVLFTLNTVTAQQRKDSIEQLNEVVVTATKFAIKKEHVGKIIYQITQEDIEHLKGKSVADILDNIAGITINGNNSSAGKDKSIFIRGGRDRQVIVLIDGVSVSDPSGVNTTFDLRLLSLNQIESIEVMNGAASTLYGSGAATGVINIKLKQAAEKPISLNYEVLAGTNNSQNDSRLDLKDFNQNITVNGILNKFSYLAAGNFSNINGLSDASDENSAVKFESDKFEASNSFVRLGYKFNEKLNVQLYSNYDKDVYDFDAGAFLDSDINNGKNEQFRFGFSSNFDYKKGMLSASASYNKNDRILDIFNSWSNATDHFDYTGKTYVADAINDYKFSDKFQMITGLNYQKQSNQTNSVYGDISEGLANYNTVDPYFTVVYNALSGFNINVGARLNMHSEYGNQWVYNINPSYNFSNNFRIISSISTAFIAPSTYQLFSQYGNVDLTPEEDKSIEFGFIYSVKKKVEINSVFFYREEENAIIIPDFITYSNSNEKSNAKGVETEIKFNILKDATVKLGHAYVYKSVDIDYIPKHKITALIEINSIKNSYVSVRFKNISKRTYFDQWGSGENINLKAYSLVDLFASHHLIKDRLSLIVQANNIFNEDYVEIIGYTTKGRNFKMGLNFKF